MRASERLIVQAEYEDPNVDLSQFAPPSDEDAYDDGIDYSLPPVTDPSGGYLPAPPPLPAPVIPVAPPAGLGALPVQPPTGVLPTAPPAGVYTPPVAYQAPDLSNLGYDPNAYDAGAGYQSVGKLSVETLLTGDADHWRHLDDKVLQTRTWVQDRLTAEGLSDMIVQARSGDRNARMEITTHIDRLLFQYLSKESLVRGADKGILTALVINEIVGLGPIEPLWQDPAITEVMVNGPESIYVERYGRALRVPGARFRDSEHVLEVINHILNPLNRRLDPNNPLEDGRLPDGSRVNAVHHAVAPEGPLLTIRRFREVIYTLPDLMEIGSMTEEMACTLAWLIKNKCNAIVAGGTGSGKALDVDTPIPTPGGFVRMGDLVDGDLVFDEQGNVVRVVKAHDVLHGRPCFEVEFSDGSVIVADADHLWLTETRQARRSQSRAKTPRERAVDEEMLQRVTVLRDVSSVGDLVTIPSLKKALELPTERAGVLYRAAESLKPVTHVLGHAADTPHPRRAKSRPLKPHVAAYDAVEFLTHLQGLLTAPLNDQRHKRTGAAVVTTTEIANTLLTASGHRNHSVTVAEALRTPLADLPIDPYLFGVWLGDGATASGRITTADSEIVTAFTDAGFIVNKVAGSDYDYGVRGLQAPLRRLGVLGAKSIPASYLFAGEEQRWALLQGLMDTDGTVGKAGTVSFSTSNPVLRDAFRSLVASLGYKNSYSTKKTRKPNGEPGKDNYVIQFAPDRVPFRLERKVLDFKRYCRAVLSDRSLRRYVVAVRPVDSRPVRCLTVDSPSRLYLAGESLIPTHNTTLLNALSCCIPRHERIATIEDSLELRFHPDSHVVSMEARPASASGKGEVTIRRLVKNSLRMRPDRVVVGEVRDAAALDMLTAMNTGHEGSLTTVHANSPDAVVGRLKTMIVQGGDMPASEIEYMIAEAVDIIIYVKRYPDGVRRVESIYEVPVPENIEGRLEMRPIWVWEPTGQKDDGTLVGEYRKVNELSDELRKARRLDLEPMLTMDDVRELSELPDWMSAKGGH